MKNEVIDTTGAGDAFNGAFAVALANKLKYKDALIFANKVAGISTTRLGAAISMPTLKEVDNYWLLFDYIKIRFIFICNR